MNSLPAVILAAGRGTRLGKLSDDQPKPMTEVGGKGIFDNLMDSLTACGVGRVVVVTGYLHDIIEEAAERYSEQCDIVTVYNEVYATTNNIYSLWLAKQYLEEGFFLFEADIFFEPPVMEMLTATHRENVMLIDVYKSWMDGTVVDLDVDGGVKNMYLKKDQSEKFDYADKYKTVNFYKINDDFANAFFLSALEEQIAAGNVNSYYELIIQEAVQRGYPFFGLKTGGRNWCEIDTQEDLRRCEGLFDAPLH